MRDVVALRGVWAASMMRMQVIIDSAGPQPYQIDFMDEYPPWGPEPKTARLRASRSAD